jgi:protein TonB
MLQPDHDIRVSTTQATPRRVISLVLVGGLHVVLIIALMNGLAQSLVKKGLEELKVATVEEPPKIKPPPPPPPPMELPPPPFVPPPDVVIDVPQAAPPPIVTQNVAPVVIPPKPAPVSTPISIGRPHTCVQNYPPISQRNNEEGTTMLSFTVGTDGNVTNPAVEKSSGFPRLDEASLSCVTRWRYKPATQDGQPVAAHWEANVQWKLH